MSQKRIPISRDFIYSLLQECMKKNDLAACRRVHSLMIWTGLDVIAVLGDHLIRLFTSCGSLVDVNHVFNKISKPSVYTWNGIISAHTKLGEEEKAVELYHTMQQVGIEPDKVTILCVLKACSNTGNIQQGRLIHIQIIRSGFHLDVVVGSSLIDMYAKCGTLEDVHRVFNKLPKQDLVSYGAMIAACVWHGYDHSALVLLERMQREGIKPSKVIIFLSLKVCGNVEAIRQGRLVHDHMCRTGFDSDNVLGSTLVDMCSKCGKLEDACRVFEMLQHRDLVSWSVMITGYAQHGHGHTALELYERMLQEGIKPDKVVLLCTLQACVSIGALGQGRLIHNQSIEHGLESDLVIGNMLLDMYGKCGSLVHAHKLFEKMPNRDVVSWGALISGYAQHGYELLALELFAKMQQEGIKPSNATFSCILKVCGSIGALEKGRAIHEQIIQSRLDKDLVVENTLVHMYAKCCSLDEAQKVFDRLQSRDLVSWDVMIAGYAEHGQGVFALELFERMQLEGMKPDKSIFLCTLKACGNVGALGLGRHIHQLIIISGLGLDVVVGSTLVDMYAKFGSLEEAHKVFDELTYQDVVSLGALIAGYTEHGDANLALQLFEKMQEKGMEPDRVMFLCIFKACGSLGALGKGRLVHCQIIGTQLELDVVIGCTLIDMYIKCGSLEEAGKVFNKLPNQDLVSWGAMISGYALYGHTRLASQCLEDMQQAGLKPDSMTFTSILNACSHAGLLKKGCCFFKSMRDDYGIIPSIEHYECVVDLLGRAGYGKEAADLLRTIPIPADVISWTSVLTGCRTYGNVGLGRQCFDQILQLDCEDASGYVLMSNIFADAHMWEDVYRVQELKNCTGVLKKPGRAWIEVSKYVQEFIVQERAHLLSDTIYAKFRRLNRISKPEGYVPQSDLVLQLM